MDTTSVEALDGRFLRLKDVCNETGMPASSVYAEMAKGEFPRPVPISARRVAWLEPEVKQWKAKQIAKRDKAVA
ncbi:AlpA family phage regulatory protein [Reyranella sp.]|uniref:helix-turn-helix transcriptional regulator n=1 Tax=Reyranella sp. TaxID=1929291 RepID=UPI000BC6E66A|nr:AlpA family phage regulatory protein [Reyranella sp.]OYY46063.1 MAG: hypothetical protein B7Y57_04205 [Rhodospirillales bacterium 35-66-84]OYZ96443.1 MAG: hypothetical protein B7Y08_04565 [Rhodospirillales bacterium 24-66-33]OZB28394.1 MAG: hypothetical protein B7X63_00580 [Rhodospirillales bacterium 39-66-50]HQS14397.1 AlpA family phage regulatory protein [Reyranella sp.]HQT11394.1 AlpA family phage regulatory protein [Reyranella sp.]